MRCALKRAFDIEAPCERCTCVYWREADSECYVGEGCVLVEYNLTGSSVDRTTRWLYEYKLSTDRARIAAYLHRVQPSHVIIGERASSAGVA